MDFKFSSLLIDLELPGRNTSHRKERKTVSHSASLQDVAELHYTKEMRFTFDVRSPSFYFSRFPVQEETPTSDDCCP